MKFRKILQEYWGYPDFRGIQREIIESVASGHDTLGLMPTGGGKSITFQVPTLAMEGMCLVITPLIALMKDQVENLRGRGIMAAAIYSGQTREEMGRILDNAVYGAYKFLYVSPERLVTSRFMAKVSAMKICLLTVDEAHCISQWGYDFRPPYLQIAEIRAYLPGVPVLALTATATPEVVDDIQDRLGFVRHRVYKMSFERRNLRYIVRATDNKEDEAVHILRAVGGSAIVYTRNRKATRLFSERLEEEGISATYYHAGLPPSDKDARQHLWQRGEARVMVATNAFGMGIDKPDVRLVIHLNVPDSLEAYFQEAGRAGRDGLTSWAVLLHDRYDLSTLRARPDRTYPPRDYIKQVYSDLAYFFQVAEGDADGRTFDFDIDRFCKTFRHFPVLLLNALSLLERSGYIHFSAEDESRSRVMFLVTREDLYHLPNLSREEERILNALMRLQGGLFSDYQTIDEQALSDATDLTPPLLYEFLKSLSRQRIIHYVPQKKMPRLTYLQRRVDTAYVSIPREVYEVQRERFERRIEKMIAYFHTDDLCRSRMLLRYFGEEAAGDCGHCDVCIAREKDYFAASPVRRRNELSANILSVLSDREWHSLETFKTDYIQREDIEKVLEELLDEEKVALEGGKVRLV